MRVAGVIEFGGPEAFKVVEIPTPEAGPGKVRIRVHAAAVNPTDTYTRNGARAAQLKEFDPPYVPGMDVAGVLDQIGDGVTTNLKVGDDVMAIVVPKGSHGGYSEYVVVPAESVVAAPDGASYAEAATLPMNTLTARLALDLLAMQPGQTLLVTGAAGAFGGYTVELAKADGLRVIADASEADHELVRSLGADVVLPRGDDLATRVRKLIPEGVDAVADGALLNELILPAVRDGGGLAAVRGFPGETERGITIHPVMVPQYAREQAKLDRIRELVNEGRMQMRVAKVLPATEAGEAHRILAAGGTRGRLILEF